MRPVSIRVKQTSSGVAALTCEPRRGVTSGNSERLSAYLALGARSGVGGHAGSTGSNSRGLKASAPDRRARLRHAQGVDGLIALPDQDAAAGPHGNEPARAGLQHEASDEDPRNANVDPDHAGVEVRPPSPLPFTRPATCRFNAQTARISTCALRFHTASTRC